MIKLATWNVNSIRTRKNHVKEWIQNENIDVLMLQELKCKDEDFPLDFFQNLGYNCEFFGQKAYNGVAILSRLPMEIIHKGLPNFQDEKSRWIEVKIANIRVISSYFPNGNLVEDEKKFGYKKEYMAKVYEYIKPLLLKDEEIILGGDYNVAPNDFDVYSIKAMAHDAICQPQSKKDFQALLNLGLYNTLDVASPIRSGIFSWWSYQSGGFNKNQGALIDFLLCSPKLIDKLESSHVDTQPRSWQQPSDHAPVVATFMTNNLKECHTIGTSSTNGDQTNGDPTNSSQTNSDPTNGDPMNQKAQHSQQEAKKPTPPTAPKPPENNNQQGSLF